VCRRRYYAEGVLTVPLRLLGAGCALTVYAIDHPARLGRCRRTGCRPFDLSMAAARASRSREGGCTTGTERASLRQSSCVSCCSTSSSRLGARLCALRAMGGGANLDAPPGLGVADTTMPGQSERRLRIPGGLGDLSPSAADLRAAAHLGAGRGDELLHLDALQVAPSPRLGRRVYGAVRGDATVTGIMSVNAAALASGIRSVYGSSVGGRVPRTPRGDAPEGQLVAPRVGVFEALEACAAETRDAERVSRHPASGTLDGASNPLLPLPRFPHLASLLV
jgi:hypothetical protein